MQLFKQLVLLAAAALLAAAPAHCANTTISATTYAGFIRTCGQRFCDANCNEFVPMGLNTWQLMEAAAGVLNTTDIAFSTGYSTDPVNYTFTTAAANNLNVIRVFGHGVTPQFQLQPAPGVYNEQAFVALDRIMALASSSGVKLIMTFGDNWFQPDGKKQYLNWTNNLNNNNTFFTDPAVKTLYKNHINAMVTRKNTITGRLYRDEPGLMAWDLMNEVRCDCFPATLYPAPPTNPECLPSCTGYLTDWVNEMATYTKSVDSNHLVTIGYEGFWANYDPHTADNPGNGWANITGQNFTVQDMPASIDFGEIHYWPDLWTLGQAPADPNFFNTWVDAHTQVAAAMNKPLLLEEFGVNVPMPATPAGLSHRNDFYTTVYSKVQSSVSSAASGQASNLRGALFWKWSYAPVNTGVDPLMVAATDNVFTSIVSPTAQQLQNLVLAKPLAACTRAAVPASSASVTQPLQPAASTNLTSAAGRRLLQQA